jgi:hypothetical protein
MRPLLRGGVEQLGQRAAAAQFVHIAAARKNMMRQTNDVRCVLGCIFQNPQ